MNTIQTNKENISSEEIEKMKDFQSLMNKYNTMPRQSTISNVWIVTGISVLSIAIIVTFFLLLPKEEASIKNNSKNLTKEKCIKPPVPKWDIPYKSIFWYNTCDTTINFTGTSKVVLKHNSLIDSTGKVVTSKIEIRYREFMNPAEIFLSGIPMTYDSANFHAEFESAGMIEIGAFQNNQPLSVLPSRPVLVSFKSSSQNTDFNLYYLDTALQRWIYKGKDKITVINSNLEKKHQEAKWLNDSITIIQNAIALLISKKPEEPVLINNRKGHFTLDILSKEFPEMTDYKTILYEIDETYKPLDKKHATIIWDDIRIRKAPQLLRYYITFFKNIDSCCYRVYPVLRSSDYKREIANYEHKYKVYKQELEKRKKDEERLIGFKMANKKTVVNNKQLLKAENTNSIISRNFNIQQFGIWNCDKPYYIENAHTLNPTFILGDTIYETTATIVDDVSKVGRQVYSNRSLEYNPSAIYNMWIVTNNNQVGVFTSEQFKKIPLDTKEYKFRMRLIKTPINSSEDFIRLYQLGFKDI